MKNEDRKTAKEKTTSGKTASGKIAHTDIRDIYVEDYHMFPSETMTAAVLKFYLRSLIEDGREEQVKAELKTIVKPKLIGVDFSKHEYGESSGYGGNSGYGAGYDPDERHFIHPELLKAYFDTPALEDLLDRAYAAAADGAEEASSPLCASIAGGLRAVKGSDAIYNIGYGFTKYLADCYTAVCY